MIKTSNAQFFFGVLGLELNFLYKKSSVSDKQILYSACSKDK